VSPRRRPYVKDRRHAIALGFAAYAVGSFLIWDAYEHRGNSRPFWHRFAGGLV
jgi:hypothetical protein